MNRKKVLAKAILRKTSRTITDNTDQVFGQIKENLSKITDIGINAKNKFITYVKEIFDILPLMEKAGFRTNRLVIGISIPPSVEIHFSRFKEIEEKEMEALKKEYADKKMFDLVLNALLMANDFQSKISSENLVFSETCLEISIPPKVSIKYLNKEIAELRRIEASFAD